MRIVTNPEMVDLDQKAIQEIGIPSLVLMENAGIEAARTIETFCKAKNYERELLIFCGKGKNGGDALVVARRLLANGHKIRVFLMNDPAQFRDEAGVQLNAIKNLKAKITLVDNPRVVEEYFKSASPPYFVVDGILGTGLKGKVEGLYFDVIELINNHADEVFSLDIPSGINGDTGEAMGTSICATATISFGFPKMGHFLTPGAARRGQLFNVDLGFPRAWHKEGDKYLLTLDNSAPLLLTRDKFGHKNSFGHCLLVGGSPGRIGAIVMASNAALKMGTGLVTVASWQDSFPSIEAKLSDEVMNFRIQKQGSEFLVPAPGLGNFSSIVVGPGLGVSREGADLLQQLLASYSGPLVIDADALNVISEYKLHATVAKRNQPTVLTPHPGEMARLLKKPKEDIISDPVRAVREAAETTNSIVLLKGASTLIHSPSTGVTWLNHYPNDGMATAGSGDVLAGMIGGLLGQRMNPFEATRLAVFLHSLSGRIATSDTSYRAMTARDLIKNIRNAFSSIQEHRLPRGQSHTSPTTLEIDG